MELVRADFPTLIGEVRKVLVTVEQEVETAKARDDLACATRILCLLEAELGFLNEHHGDVLSLLDRVTYTVRPLLDQVELAGLKADLERIATGGFTGPHDRLRALRTSFQRAIPALGTIADRGEALAVRALHQLLDMETAQFEAVTARRRQLEAGLDDAQKDGSGRALSRPAGAHELPRHVLRDYLRAAFPKETGLEIESVCNVPGGRSKETTMIALSGVAALPERIVLRSDIPGGLVPSFTADEFAILRIADRHGVPVPRPLHCEADAGRLGRTFIIVSAVDGATQGDYFPELGGDIPEKVELGRQLARILALIHQIPLRELEGTHIDTSANLSALVLETIDSTYRQACQSDAPARIHLEMAHRWLKANLHLGEDEPCLIHCDIGLHNMLVDNGRITAMLDWELATLGSPAREISKIFHLIDYLMPRQEFIAEYLAAGGPERAVDPHRMNFYAILNYMVTHQRARFANQLFYDGAMRNIVMGNAGYDFFYRGVQLLSDCLKPAYDGAYGDADSYLKR